ncbi:Aminopeptidase N [Penaeus vannamei]|uniref:Aminopeptidase N n=1 Tax=Penaeus vannamei TaxID=6689 RepID=A0A423SXR0_PENVA|nr:Aminopeptidase N [Penaeus vannamei]
MWDRYEKSVPMSTYLVAFVVSDYVHINSTENDRVDFRVWARQETIDQAEYANEIGPKILRFFEDYFNLSYPLPKMDMIALTDFSAGAMENWGLITYRESIFLYDPQVSTPVDKAVIASIVSHELAHQWFGNLVTPKWWDDLWLNEGFATYISYLGVDHVEPTWKAMEEIVVEIVHRVFDLDSLESLPQDQFPSQTRTRYPNTYNSSVQDDLWKHLTLAAHEDGILPQEVTVKMIMDTWTLQMGYPVVKVTRSPDGTSATLTQERFLLEGSANSSSTTDYKWWVPLTFTTQNEANFSQTQASLWMKDSEDHVTVSSLPPKDQWVIFNLQQAAYYRVNYDDHNWNLIIQQLKKDHQVISPVNRGQIVDDAMNLARAGHLRYKLALDVLLYLRNEGEYLPWATGADKFVYIESMFKRRSGFGALKSVGFDNNIEDSFLEQQKRKIAVKWACRLGHKDCLNKALTLYRHWMSQPDNSSIISPNLKPVVYCRAIAEGGEAEWDFAWDQYVTSSVATEKKLLLRSMSCSKQTWILSRYVVLPVCERGWRVGEAGRVSGEDKGMVLHLWIAQWPRGAKTTAKSRTAELKPILAFCSWKETTLDHLESLAI